MRSSLASTGLYADRGWLRGLTTAGMLLALRDAHQQREAVGQPSVLLVADSLREFLARFVRPAVKGLHVHIAWTEHSLVICEVKDWNLIEFWYHL